MKNRTIHKFSEFVVSIVAAFAGTAWDVTARSVAWFEREREAQRWSAKGTVVRLVLAVSLAMWITTGVQAFYNKINNVIAVPPSNTTMYQILTRSLTLTEIERRTDSVAATPESAFTTDLTVGPPNERTDAFAQQMLIRNTSADLGATGTLLCYGELAWAAPATTCQSICAAAAAVLTCTGASTDGRHIAPGMEISTREDGTVCGCVVGNVAGTAYQTTRSTR